jgi:hypothetical protein
MSKITNGFVLFSLLMAFSLGVAFAESEMAANETVTVNNTTVNESVNETLNQTMNETANETINETATEAAAEAK